MVGLPGSGKNSSVSGAGVQPKQHRHKMSTKRFIGVSLNKEGGRDATQLANPCGDGEGDKYQPTNETDDGVSIPGNVLGKTRIEAKRKAECTKADIYHESNTLTEK